MSAVTPEDTQHLQNWRIEVMDISGRWARIPGHDLRVDLLGHNVLLHEWPEHEGLDLDQVVAVLKECVPRQVWEKHNSKYKGRPIRLANIKTGDFMPFEILGIEKPKVTLRTAAEEAQDHLDQNKSAMVDSMKSTIQKRIDDAARVASTARGVGSHLFRDEKTHLAQRITLEGPPICAERELPPWSK
jgi:hypothetical protein